ncbi:MAG: putative intracellular septation protein A [Idiomarina sp. T82-3]|uniref:inner membrane-spanning protein YciB n=1 Tax=Idiomarina TaxID=135575 RepID=UPI000797997B|nr:inner membrane-spanning protein YciB [Idiomarina sp. T82-3]KXS35438.1 MAG: putative intracellular septation protein A [Idiomarina sp. T82-3]
MALVLEYLPLVVFFVVYQMVDIFAATWALMGLTIIQLVGLKLLKQPITTRHWIVLGAVLVFGGITVFLHDDWFVKIKVSIIYVLIAALLAGTLWIKKTSPLKSLFDADIKMPDSAWNRLTYAWVITCLAIAAVNVYVAQYMSQDAWVNFKVFGIIGISLVLVVATGMYIYRHAEDMEGDK